MNKRGDVERGSQDILVEAERVVVLVFVAVFVIGDVFVDFG
jgi:hypothetical protein